jgi:ribosome-associated protein
MLEPETLNLVRLATAAARDTKAFELAILDVSAVTSFTDAFILCSTSSDRHLEAVAEAVLRRLRRHRRRPLHTEGGSGSHWILVDYGELIVHVFTEERRAYYNLEGLWGDAPRLSPEDLGLEREPGPAPDAPN